MIPDILPLVFNIHKALKVKKSWERTTDLMDNMNPYSIENRDLCKLSKATDKILFLSRRLREKAYLSLWPGQIPTVSLICVVQTVNPHCGFTLHLITSSIINGQAHMEKEGSGSSYIPSMGLQAGQPPK